MKQLFQIIFISLLILAPQVIHARTFIATGSYNAGFYMYYPMLIVSPDNGASWTLNENIQDLSKYPTIQLKDTACVKNSCVSVGTNFTVSPLGDSTIDHPYILASQDRGVSWSPSEIEGLSSIGIILSVTCANDTCTAVGYSQDDSYPHPLMFSSHDNGKSWSNFQNIQHLPKIKDGNFSKVTCVDNNCIAMGDYTNGDYVYRPLLVYSRDSGKSWIFTPKVTNLPDKLKYAILETVKCDNNYCVAAGFLKQVDFYARREPCILHSSDYGQSWTMINNIAGTVPQDKNVGIKELAISADGSFIAIGYAAEGDTPSPGSASKPLLFFGQNHGKSWAAIKNVPGFPENRYGLFNAISCVKNFCMTAGEHYYENGSDHLPIIISHDGGKSWTLGKDMGEEVGYLATIFNINCREDICILGGESIPTKPFILTTDLGKSWSIKKINGMPAGSLMGLQFPMVGNTD